MVIVETKNIKEIKNGNTNYENDRKSKDVLDLSLLGLDAPTFEIVLNHPIKSKAFLGKSRLISRIFFSIDDKDSFFSLIIKRIE